MRVYLVQHGKAKPAEEDPSRGLTGEGYAEVKQIADFLAGLRITVSLIQHSGKKRAEETAHLLATSKRNLESRLGGGARASASADALGCLGDDET